MDSRFLDVNRDGVLRVPAMLWFAWALLIRYWLLLILVAVSARRNPDAFLLLGGSLSWPMAALEIPAFLVILAAGRRVPDAWPVFRFLWRRGRELMAMTVLANLVWTGLYLARSDYWAPWPELFLASCCLLDLAIILSVYINPLHKQLFNEFPAPVAPAKPVPGEQQEKAAP